MKKSNKLIIRDFLDEEIKKIKEEFPELDNKGYGDLYIYEFGIRLREQKLLYEGLTITTNISKSVGIIQRKYNLTDYFIKEDKKNNKIALYFVRDYRIINQFNIDEFLQMLNNLGWYPSYIQWFDIKSNGAKWSKEKFKQLFDIKNWNSIYFLLRIDIEAKFDIEVDVPNKIYHTSPMFYRDRILKYGLIPKSKNKFLIYPDRIYFIKNKNEAKYLAKQLIEYLPQKTIQYFNEKKIPIEYDVYEIDTSNMTHSRWFEDPNKTEGIYCLMNIEPQYIKLINTIEI